MKYVSTLSNLVLGLSCSVAVLTLGASEAVRANPIVPAQDGTGTRVTPLGNEFQIQGGTLSGDQANLFHSFEQFGLDPNQIANFLAQPQLRHILGRVVGGDPSVIHGLIRVSGGSANLFLMNPSGFVFGPGARLDVPGNFTATTANGIELGDEWFSAAGVNDYGALNGDPTALGFTMADPGAILNAGDLGLSPGKTLALVAGSVANSGSLTAPEGQIILASMPEPGIVRFSQPGQVLTVEYDLGLAGDLPEDWQLPIAQLPDLISLEQDYDLGFVLQPDGSVMLSVSPVETGAGVTVLGGTADVSGTTAGSTGGTIAALGETVQTVEATLTANGPAGGGNIFLGGDYQGQNTLPTAQTTRIDRGTQIAANALNTGDGGKVIVWADDFTSYQGRISATGGPNGGDGGFVEVSGAKTLAFNGPVDVSAPQGAAGTILLDPQDIIIVPSIGSNDIEVSDNTINAADGGTTTDFTIGDFTLTSLTGNIFLQATRDIIAGAGVSLFFSNQGSNTAVTFDAGRNISLNLSPSGISSLGTLGGSLNFNAGNNITVSNTSEIATLGGDINFRAGGDITLSSLLFSSGGNVSLNAGNNVTLNAGTGSINYSGIETGGGNLNITAGGTIDASGADAAQVSNADLIGINYSLDSSNDFGNGGAVTLKAGGDVNAAFIATSSGSQTGNGGSLSITSSGGAINGRLSNIPFSGTSGSGTVETGLYLTGADDGNGGSVTLNASGNINVGAIATGSQNGSGGAVTINSSSGSINAVSSATATGFSNISSAQYGAIGTSSETGNGGAVTLNAAGNIDTGVIITSSLDGNAGNITLSSSGGAINTSYDLLTANPSSSLWLELANQFELNGVQVNGQNYDNATAANLLGSANVRLGTLAFSENGNGGNVTMTANGDITTSNIITGSLYGNGGNISLTSNNGSIDGSAAILLSDVSANLLTELGYSQQIADTIAYLSSPSVRWGGYISLSLTGNAGNISLNAPNGNILTNYLIASSFSGQGGAINVNAGGFVDFNGLIFNQSSAVTANNAIAGEDETLVQLVNTLSRGNIASSGATGGNISIQSNNYINAGTLNSSGTSGDGGDVLVDPPNGITLAYINAQGGNTGRGGNVTIQSDSFLRLVDAFNDRNGVFASISTAGGLGGGNIGITITSGGFGLLPFRIGNPSSNGSLGALTTGDFTIPVGTDIYFTTSVGNITITTLDPTVTTINSILDLDPCASSPASCLSKSSPSLTEGTQLPTVDEIREILANIERLTGIKPALIYANFIPNNNNLVTSLGNTVEDVIVGMEGTFSSEIGKQVQSAVAPLEAPLQLPSSNQDIIELIVVTADQDPVRTVVDETTRLKFEDVLFGLRSDITNQAPLGALLPKSRQLHRWLIEPIMATLQEQEVENLVFIMGDDLRLVPLAALYDGERFIIEDYSVGLMPSMALADTRYSSVQNMSLLAMGADTFSDESPLYAVPSELSIIADIWPTAEAILNDSFTPETLQTVRRQQRSGLVHLATHGIFNRGDTSQSYIRFSDRRVGLHELEQLQLYSPTTELVVLSACQTAFGTSDDEVELGFAGLAHKAGAKSVLGSLWSVGDQSTLGLMTGFYDNLRTAPIKAEALRQAQLAMLRGEVRFEDNAIVVGDDRRYPLAEATIANFTDQSDLTHPFAWSAFTMIGSPW